MEMPVILRCDGPAKFIWSDSLSNTTGTGNSASKSALFHISAVCSQLTQGCHSWTDCRWDVFLRPLSPLEDLPLICCDTLPVWCQTYGYLPSSRALLLLLISNPTEGRRLSWHELLARYRTASISAVWLISNRAQRLLVWPVPLTLCQVTSGGGRNTLWK